MKKNEYCQIDPATNHSRCQIALNNDPKGFGQIELQSITFNNLQYNPEQTSFVIIESSNSLKIVLGGVTVNSTFHYILDTPMVRDEGKGCVHIDGLTLTSVITPYTDEDGLFKIMMDTLVIDS